MQGGGYIDTLTGVSSPLLSRLQKASSESCRILQYVRSAVQEAYCVNHVRIVIALTIQDFPQWRFRTDFDTFAIRVRGPTAANALLKSNVFDAISPIAVVCELPLCVECEQHRRRHAQMLSSPSLCPSRFHHQQAPAVCHERVH